MDQNPFQAIYDHEEFCQGDVLHCGNGDNGGLGAFGVVITADCDIAQGKDGGEFTVLRIVPAERFIEHDWAANEVRKLAARQRVLALDIMNAAIARSNPALDRLTADALSRWLADEPPERIIAAVGLAPDQGPGRDAVRALHCVREADAQSGHPALHALGRIWQRLDTKPKAIQSRLSDVLHPARGAADIYFVPYLPDFTDIGFVIQLRRLSAISRDEVYKSKTDARVGGGERAFYRIGRFRDGVKHSIVHQLVNLFSRVGLSEAYETESSVAAEFVVDVLSGRLKEMTI